MAAISLAVSLSSCLHDTPEAPPRTHLVVGTALPAVRTPDTGVTSVINSLTLEAPIAIAWDGRPVGRAFDTWDWLPDRRGLKLHVRAGIYFHDGTPLTNSLAADIVRTYFESQNLTTVAVASVEPQGSSDIVITTLKPEGFLLSELSTINFSLPGKPRVGTGPFKYVAAGPPIRLDGFERYHLGVPQIDQVEIKQYQSQRAAWGAMMRNEIDMLHDVNMEAVDFVEAETSIATHARRCGSKRSVRRSTKGSTGTPSSARQCAGEARPRSARCGPFTGPFRPPSRTTLSIRTRRSGVSMRRGGRSARRPSAACRVDSRFSA